jgi:hypothetical protein
LPFILVAEAPVKAAESATAKKASRKIAADFFTAELLLVRA